MEAFGLPLIPWPEELPAWVRLMEVLFAVGGLAVVMGTPNGGPVGRGPVIGGLIVGELGLTAGGLTEGGLIVMFSVIAFVVAVLLVTLFVVLLTMLFNDCPWFVFPLVIDPAWYVSKVVGLFASSFTDVVSFDKLSLMFNELGAADPEAGLSTELIASACTPDSTFVTPSNFTGW
jgi:hypothetical protein